ncbi:hypothetical protein A2U01_0082067, partial [Trifolium medium]|nr:hypothetical protein [Trifolium medium]
FNRHRAPCSACCRQERILKSPGDVLDCHRARSGDGVASCRQKSPVNGQLSVAWSLAVARRA